MSLVAEADFGLSLLRKVSIDETTFLSPFSVALGLSLVHLGAKGTSKEQIKNVLCKEASSDDCVNYFSSLQRAIVNRDHPYLKNWEYCSKPGNISCVPENQRINFNPEEVPTDFPLLNTDVLLNIANRVFASNNIFVKKEYQDELESIFNAALQNLNYSNPRKAAQIVNNFVRNETAGTIDKLVGPDSFEDDKLALLVNAVFFHGLWVTKFDPFLIERTFYVEEGNSKEVDFMNHHCEYLPVHITKDFTALSLPYINKKYRMTIVLPNKRFGLAEALRYLSGEQLQELISHKNTSVVNAAIPQFKIETELELQEVLKNMGITDVFNDNADLSGISDSKLKLDRIKHKVMLDFNRRGTTASAATSIEFRRLSGKYVNEEPIIFVADHPFLFVLSYEGHILFTGQYYG